MHGGLAGYVSEFAATHGLEQAESLSRAAASCKRCSFDCDALG